MRQRAVARQSTFRQSVSEKVSALPSRLSHPDPESLPQRSRWRFRPAKGGKFHAQGPTFFWGRDASEKPFQQTKAFAEKRSDVAVFPLPIPSAPSAFSAGVLTIRPRRPFVVARGVSYGLLSGANHAESRFPSIPKPIVTPTPMVRFLHLRSSADPTLPLSTTHRPQASGL